ncbi:MT-A70-domain-containing protein [Chytriomyces sp. MP71]|nr:MT-A70-domain-containing protein [Chytriomyces sp. MP71]
MWAKNTHFANTSTRDTLRIGSTVIPPLASFLISDIAQFSWPSKYSNYALVVADPPWPNLSASRANAYNTLDPYYLFSIDLKHHLVPGALVAVWVTHKLKYKQFVTDKLFPAWGVQFAAEWTWLKVTTHGDLMFDKKLANRRPYEILLIGRRAGHSDTSQLALPREMLFASVPSSHHSQKPFLDSLLEPYLPKPESPQPSLPKHFLISKLELFARMTRTGWHSWGNECLKFNHLSCLEERIFESKNQQNKV